MRQNIINNISIILSDICGMGKTDYIKSNINNDKEIYINFSLGGYLEKNDIIAKLNKEISNIKNENKLLSFIWIYMILYLKEQ